MEAIFKPQSWLYTYLYVSHIVKVVGCVCGVCGGRGGRGVVSKLVGVRFASLLRMITPYLFFDFLSDGKSSPRQSEGHSESKSYHDDGDDDDDGYTACTCQRWLFIAIFMPIFVVLSILGFIFILLLMPCKYQRRCSVSFLNVNSLVTSRGLIM